MRVCSAALAMPKSASLMMPVSLESSRLPGLTSRWTTPGAVGVVEPVAGVAHDLHGLLDVEHLVLAQQVGGRRAVDVLHDDVVALALGVLARVEHLDDVRVLQARRRERLAAEAGDEVLVLGQVLGQQLDRHRALEHRVGGQEHGRHAAGAEPAVDPVAARDLGAGALIAVLGSPPPVPPSAPSSGGVVSVAGRSRWAGSSVGSSSCPSSRSASSPSVGRLGGGRSPSRSSRCRSGPARRRTARRSARTGGRSSPRARSRTSPSTLAGSERGSTPTAGWESSVMSSQAPPPASKRRCTSVEPRLQLLRPSRPGSTASSPRRRRSPRPRPAASASSSVVGVRSVTVRCRAAGRAPSGRPASSIARAASSIGYSTRRHSALHASVSSRSHAARGSPSRGWPTRAGVQQPLALAQIPLQAALRGGSLDLALAVAPEPERHVRMADRAHARLHQVHALVGLPGRRARTPRPGRAATRGRGRSRGRRSGAQGAQELERARRRCCSRVHSAAAAALDEKSAMSISPVTTRSWLPARQRSQRLARQLDAAVGLGAVADQVAQAPDLLDAGGVDVGQHGLEGRQVAVHVREQGDAHRVPSTVSGEWKPGVPVAIWALAAAAGIAVAVVAAGAATFLLRPRSGMIEPAAVDAKSYFTAFQLDRAEDFRGVQRLIARGRAGARHRHAGAAGVASAAAPDRADHAAADPGRGRRRGGHLAAAGGRRPAAVGVEPPARGRRRACRPRTGPTGSATSASRPRSVPASRRSAPRSRWRWCGASRATGGRPARSWWSPSA